MTSHDHTTIVPGCYRCELGQDETVPLCACCREVYEYRHPDHDPWQGRMDAYCLDCSHARCDAYPGDCGKPKANRPTRKDA